MPSDSQEKAHNYFIVLYLFKAVFLKLWAAAQDWAAEGLYLGREAFNRNREETLHFHFFLNNVFKSAREHHADTTQ